MSKGYNRVTLFGNLGAEPELRRIASGNTLLRMRVATSQSWMSKEGSREERTEWHTVILWGSRAEGLARILRKGSLVLIEGQLHTHSYEKDGEKRHVTEILAHDLVLGGRNRTPDAGGDSERFPDARAENDAGFEADLRSEREARPDERPRHEPDAHPESGGRQAPEPEPEPAPIAPKAPRGGDGGAAQVDLPPPPPRKRTRSPAPAPVMADAA